MRYSAFFSIIALFFFITLGAASAQYDFNQSGVSSPVLAQSPGMSLADFRSLWDREGKTPEGAIKCLLIAVLETVKEENPDGLKMWGIPLPKDTLSPNGQPSPGHVNFIITQFGRQIQGTGFRGAIAASYLGGSPQNGYKYSYSNTVSVDSRNAQGGDEVKIFIRSGGKDNPSPVTLKRNNSGYWKIFNYSSLYTGVRPAGGGDF
ncbi:MAG: hypothetical protein AB2L14_10290 [Candidatus Xenobiia bacterium LiM19]